MLTTQIKFVGREVPLTAFVRELTIGDNIGAHFKIEYALPKRQAVIIKAIGDCAELVQVYSHSKQKLSWRVESPFGGHEPPHTSAVNALIRKNLITPIDISDKEWAVQVALGTAEKRIWEINPALFDPLINAICLIRLIEEDLKSRKVFNGYK